MNIFWNSIECFSSLKEKRDQWKQREWLLSLFPVPEERKYAMARSRKKRFSVSFSYFLISETENTYEAEV